HANARSRTDFGGCRLQGVFAARVDHHVDAFVCQRKRASLAKALAGRTHDGLAAANPQVHEFELPYAAVAAGAGRLCRTPSFMIAMRRVRSSSIETSASGSPSTSRRSAR